MLRNARKVSLESQISKLVSPVLLSITEESATPVVPTLSSMFGKAEKIQRPLLEPIREVSFVQLNGQMANFIQVAKTEMCQSQIH